MPRRDEAAVVLTPGSVYRIKSLESKGIIKGYTCILDRKKLGRGVSAHILLNINFDKLSKKMMNEEDLADKLLATGDALVHRLLAEVTIRPEQAPNRPGATRPRRQSPAAHPWTPCTEPMTRSSAE